MAEWQGGEIFLAGGSGWCCIVATVIVDED